MSQPLLVLGVNLADARQAALAFDCPVILGSPLALGYIGQRISDFTISERLCQMLDNGSYAKRTNAERAVKAAEITKRKSNNSRQ